MISRLAKSAKAIDFTNSYEGGGVGIHPPPGGLTAKTFDLAANYEHNTSDYNNS